MSILIKYWENKNKYRNQLVTVPDFNSDDRFLTILPWNQFLFDIGKQYDGKKKENELTTKILESV